MTGLGERAHLASPNVSLETNVADIVGVLEYEDLTDVNLVGHSATGTVIAGAADLLPRRVSNLIYLDAIVPQDGQSAWELLGPRNCEWFEEMLATTERKWLLPVPEEEHLFGIRDAADARWVKSKLTPQPVRPWRDAVRLTGSGGVRRSYIYCDHRGNTYADTAARVRSDPGWQYRELRTGHDAMITAPRELADILVELAVR
jgi:pimeloyl-ACP methyl ester carboxylesterase